jgi:hypothetical protein
MNLCKVWVERCGAAKAIEDEIYGSPSPGRGSSTAAS